MKLKAVICACEVVDASCSFPHTDDWAVQLDLWVPTGGEWVNFCVNLNHDCNSKLLIGKTEMEAIFLNCVQLCGH